MRSGILTVLNKTLKTDDDRKFFDNLVAHQDEYNALKPYKGSSSAKPAFQKIYKLRPNLIKNIYQKFRWDFILFGYSTDGYL